tara:strand:- start:149 stop:361 length:213 start_codon:yes stop_codon:yes gene_type:complete
MAPVPFIRGASAGGVFPVRELLRYSRGQAPLDFEISDALAKPERPGAVGRDHGDRWRAYPPEQALVTLSR